VKRAAAILAALVVAGAVYAGGNGVGSGGLNGFPPTPPAVAFGFDGGAIEASTVTVSGNVIASRFLSPVGVTGVTHGRFDGANFTGMGFDDGTDSIEFYTSGQSIWALDGTTHGFLLATPSGENAIHFTNAGARLKFSAGGTTDYLTGDGATTVSTPGAFTAASVTSPLGKLGVLDAGTGMVNGQLQVLGPLVASSSVTVTGVVTMNDNTCRLAGGSATLWFSASGAGAGALESGMASVSQTAQNAAFRFFTDNAASATNSTVIGVRGGASGAAGQQWGVTHDGKFVFNNDGGAAEIAGRSVLVAGTVTVSTTAVTATSDFQLTRCVTGGTVGHLSVGTVTAGTSFVINSSSGTDTSTVCWLVYDRF